MNKNIFIVKKGTSISNSFSGFLVFLGIVLFIFVLFAGISSSFADVLPVIGDRTEITFVKDSSCEYELAGTLIKLANSPVITNNKKILMTEFISEANLDSSEDSEIFKKYSAEIFSDSFPESSWKGGTHPWWVKVQNISEEIKKPEFSEKFFSGGDNCNPFEDVSLEIVTKNKKIIGCLLKSYCEKDFEKLRKELLENEK